MKKIISILLALSILTVCLSSCKNKETTAPTCQEVIDAYKSAGYNVSRHKSQYKDDNFDDICYVQVWLDDKYESAYFYFFESAEAAKARDEEREFNVFVYLFTIIFGDPTWVYSKTYGNIQYEYEDSKMIKPFKALIK